MAELLTRKIVYEYQQRLKALPEYGRQDIKERRELRIELQSRCGITELQALNVLNGYYVSDIITICERKRWEDEFMTNMEIKTIKGWEKFTDEHSEGNTNWGSYCKPGDLVGEDVYDYFLDILPPRSLSRGYLQVGEPYSTVMNCKTGKYQNTYATFVATGKKGVYRYCGICFAGETEDVGTHKEYFSGS